MFFFHINTILCQINSTHSKVWKQSCLGYTVIFLNSDLCSNILPYSPPFSLHSLLLWSLPYYGPHLSEFLPCFFIDQPACREWCCWCIGNSVLLFCGGWLAGLGYSNIFCVGSTPELPELGSQREEDFYINLFTFIRYTQQEKKRRKDYITLCISF